MDAERYYVRVIHIAARDSPNVRRALEQQARGEVPDGLVVCPGVLTWQEYQERRATWDEVRQCVGLDGEFWRGKDALLFPPQWLDRAHEMARARRGQVWPKRWMGVDPGEGVAETAWSVVDRLGLVKLVAKRTPDTSDIVGDTLAMMREYNVKPADVCIDRGGGGKQIADMLRRQGWPVRTVAFGGKPVLEPRRGLRPISDRKENVEDRYVYASVRAQMYHELSLQLDPSFNPDGFSLSDEYRELRRQLAPIPRWTDGEGSVFLPQKKQRSDAVQGGERKQTMEDLIGCSPDQADSLVLAVHAMLHKGTRTTAGAMV